MTTHRTPLDLLRSRSSGRRARRGSISILSAVSAIALVALIGLGLDTALVFTARQQLQRTADACALAAVNRIKIPDQTDYNLVRQAAIDTAAALSNNVIRCGPSGIVLDPNVTNVEDPANFAGDIVVGRWSFDSATQQFGFVPTDHETGLPIPDAVKVRAKCSSAYSQNSSLELLFGHFFNLLWGTPTESNVGSEAIARLAPPDEALILVLDRHKRGSLLINGGAYMDVRAGTIQVDSDHNCALQMNGTSGLMEAQRIRVVGGACVDSLNLHGNLITGSPYVPDPLENLVEPDRSLMPVHSAITSAGAYLPGYYPNGIDMNGGIAELSDGIYVIGDAPPARGIDLKGDAFIEGTRVLLYLEGNAGVSVSGSGAGMHLTPMTSGPYAHDGVTVFHARSGTRESRINGGGVFEVRGTYYIPNGILEIGGNTTRIIGRIIVDELLLFGDPRFEITGDNVPPSDDPPTVFLVQ